MGNGVACLPQCLSTELDLGVRQRGQKSARINIAFVAFVANTAMVSGTEAKPHAILRGSFLCHWR